MQTASAGLIAAQTAKEQYPELSVLADWAHNGTTVFDPGVFRDTFHDTWEGLGNLDDLTPFVKSIRVGRALSTDLPEGVRAVTGLAAADATIVLAGKLSWMDLTKIFAPYDNVLNDLAPRLSAPIVASIGMRGTEKLAQITGQVRGCLVDPDAGTVTLTVIDNRLTFRTPVVLPVVFADDHSTDLDFAKRPGLNAGWLLDWIARQQGYYQSPPVRDRATYSATFHGSVWPELGTVLGSMKLDAGDLAGPVAFAPARFGLGTDSDQFFTGTHLLTTPASLVGDLFIEGWFKAESGTQLLLDIDVDFGIGIDNILLFHVGGSGFELDMNVNGAGFDFTPGVAATAGWHYVAVHHSGVGSTSTVRIRVDGTTVYDNSHVWGTTLASRPTLPYIMYYDLAGREAVQVSTEPYSTTMWNDAFAPTAILETSLNELTSTPTVDTSDPWTIGQQIADAEQGMATFTEDGIFHFYNRNHLTGGAAVATITTDPTVEFANLKTRSSEEKADGVRNVISVPATPYTLDPAGTVLWSLSELMFVPPTGTIRIPADFPGPVYTLTTLSYRAARRADGAGGDIVNLAITTVAVTASTYDIVVTNPNAFGAYIVGNAAGGVPGEPTMTLTGRCVRASESAYKAVRTNQGSVDRYGSQPLDVPANPFRQAATAADGLADDLIAVLPTPHPTLSDLEILGDTRLQLADRARVADREGLSLDADFWLTQLETRFSRADGFSQTVSVRKA